jgi:hypothetical protein
MEEPPTPEEETAREAAEMAARLAAWRAAQAQWWIETRRPWRQRETFSVAELTRALILRPVQGEIGLARGRIAIDVVEWATQGRFEEDDVLLLDGQTQSFVLFLPAYRAELDAAERRGRHLRGEPDSDVDRPALEQLGKDVWVNHGAVILRRPAVRHYLEGCGHA